MNLKFQHSLTKRDNSIKSNFIKTVAMFRNNEFLNRFYEKTNDRNGFCNIHNKYLKNELIQKWY